MRVVKIIEVDRFAKRERKCEVVLATSKKEKESLLNPQKPCFTGLSDDLSVPKFFCAALKSKIGL